MKNMMFIRVAVIASLVLCTVVVYALPSGSDLLSAPSIEKGHCKRAMLCVTFLNVGQGDATFIESPSGVQVLIDGGPGGSVLSGLGDQMGFFDRTIDMVVATHPDLDHIGGLVDVLQRYEVRSIVLTENKSDTPVAEAFWERVENEKGELVYARRGQVIDLGMGEAGSTTLTILFPDRDPTGLESNTSSIVARLTYGEVDVLLTGDSPQSIEEYLVDSGAELASEILKVGHHGSRTSTGERFLDAVSPRYAIISAGKDNSYGHPHVEVTYRLFNHGVEIKNTAEEGSIFVESDGVGLWFR